MVDWAMHARLGTMLGAHDMILDRHPSADTDSTRGIASGYQPPPPRVIPVAKVIVEAVILKPRG